MCTHAGQARVSAIRPNEMVQTQCRAMEDMVIPPGKCREVGAPMAIDMEVGALNAGMLFQAVATVQCAGGPAMYYEGEGPEMGEQEKPKGGDTPEGAASMPEMIVNPLWHEESGQAVVYLVVANIRISPHFLVKLQNWVSSEKSVFAA